jgi:hypothetical protein
LAALDLGIRLSIAERVPGTPPRFDAFDDDEMNPSIDDDSDEREPARIGPEVVLHKPSRASIEVARAVGWLASGDAFAGLPELPAPWAASTGGTGRTPAGDAASRYISDRRRLVSPDRYLRTDLVGRLLRAIPIDDVSRDPTLRDTLIALGEHLLRWTIDKVAPPGSDPHGRHERASSLFGWRSAIMGWLATFGARLDPALVERRFLNALFALPIDIRADFLGRFVPLYVAAAVVDAPMIQTGTMELLQSCFAAVLDDSAWDRARRNPSGGLESSLHEIVRAVLMTDWDGTASAAVRFANGDWTDIARLQPVVRDVLACVGDIPSVLSAYLRLVERGFDHYSAEYFLADVRLIPPTVWTTRALWIPNQNAARIAALVQRFVERDRPLGGQQYAHALELLDRLVDVGDRRSAALQVSELLLARPAA